MPLLPARLPRMLVPGTLWLVLVAQAPPHAAVGRVAQPVPLEQATTTVELADPSLSIDLVASEPLVQSPTSITFDEHGRLFVVEMLDYPHDRDTHPGRISLLEDTNGDGIFDKATVYADNLPWPSGAFVYDGGLFVTASPDILYLKDTDGDGRADERRVVYTGFANTVPEAMPDMVVNGFAWGLDNRIYGATSRNGGIVKAPGLQQTYDLRGRDFSIDPRTERLRVEVGGGQFGVSFDDYGRRFVSSNANHMMLAMYELRYTARNPYVEYPRPIIDIPEDGPSAPVFRISPDEDWRVIRTQWRTSGKVRGLVEHGGKAGGYFTSACNLLVYRGDALPREYYGSAIVAEPANNLAHRKLIVDNGIPLKGVKPAREAGTEFLRSASVWFRPVSFATGPDGALYVVDMHRAIVEDPKTIPAEIVSTLDVRAGSTMGRIFRIARKGVPRASVPVLATAGGPALAAAFEHPNGWVRDTAARLVYERQDTTAAPALARLARESASGPARLRALYALQGLSRLTAAQVTAALDDADAGVREHAVRLAEGFVDDTALRTALLARATDPAPRVRYQLAFTLGALPFDADVLSAFHTLVTSHADDVWMRTAALTSLSHPLMPILERLTSTSGFASTPGGSAFVGQMLRTIGARGQRAELDAALGFMDGVTDERLRLTFARDLFGGFARGDVAVDKADPAGRLAGTLDVARRLASDRATDAALRVTALELLAQDPRVDHVAFLAVVQPIEPQAVQAAALLALRQRDHADIAPALVGRWGALTPRLRQDALGLLIARPDRALLLLHALREKTVVTSDLTAGQAQALLNHPDAEVARVAAGLLTLGTSTRQQVVDAYLPALALPADAARGREVFANACASCHRLEDVGVDLGPNLLGVRNHGREGMLIDIFDPNRKVDPAYLFYEIELRTGDTLLGAIADETTETLTVAQAYGARTVVRRADIAGMRSVGQSMMPEGLESAMSQQELADLLEYILTR